MDYFALIETPAATQEAEPLITTLELTAGRLIGGQVIYPEGSLWLHHIRLYLASFVLAPRNLDADYSGENCSIDLDLDHDMFGDPHRLHIKSWNKNEQSALTAMVVIHLDPYAKPRHKKSFLAKAADLVPGYVKGTERRIPPKTENNKI